MSGYDFSVLPDDEAGTDSLDVALNEPSWTDALSDVAKSFGAVVNKVPAGYEAYRTSDGDLTKKALSVLYATGLYGRDAGAGAEEPEGYAQRPSPWWQQPNFVLPAIGVGAVGIWLATRGRR